MTGSEEREPIRRLKPKWLRAKKRKVKEVKPAPETFHKRREAKEAKRRRRMNEE